MTTFAEREYTQRSAAKNYYGRRTANRQQIQSKNILVIPFQEAKQERPQTVRMGETQNAPKA